MSLRTNGIFSGRGRGRKSLNEGVGVFSPKPLGFSGTAPRTAQPIPEGFPGTQEDWDMFSERSGADEQIQSEAAARSEAARFADMCVRHAKDLPALVKKASSSKNAGGMEQLAIEANYLQDAVNGLQKAIDKAIG